MRLVQLHAFSARHRRAKPRAMGPTAFCRYLAEM